MRGIEMRANALASVPFQIVRGETPIDTSDEYKDTLGILPDPYRVLWCDGLNTVSPYASMNRRKTEG